MSYQTELEQTVQGDFAELYDFAIAGQHWRYTSYQTDVVFAGETDYAATIKRSEWASEDELKPIQVKITVPLTNFVAKFVANYPIQRVAVTITRWFTADPLAYFQLFSGETLNVVVTKSGAEISCESASLLYSSLLPKIVHQAFCNHALFDDNCGLDEFDYRVSASGVTVASSTIEHATFDTYDDDYFTWGKVKTADGDYRMITAHVGDTITLQTPFPTTSLATGGNVIAWPGCGKSKAICQAKFNNFVNFLGFPFIPSHNPVIFGIETEE
jgi:hypothetical protein